MSTQLVRSTNKVGFDERTTLSVKPCMVRFCKVSEQQDWLFFGQNFVALTFWHWTNALATALLKRQISEQWDNSKYKSHKFKTLRHDERLHQILKHPQDLIISVRWFPFQRKCFMTSVIGILDEPEITCVSWLRQLSCVCHGWGMFPYSSE